MDAPARRQTIVGAIVSARRNDQSVVFEASDVAVVYEDRRLRLPVDEGEHRRLDALLDDYHVFKIKQPETRKAESDVVYISAVTDAKHAADFVEELFRSVYGADEDYGLRVERR